MPVDHYENFPVASVLLPARLREPVEAIYAFARSADDLADEGNATPDERLAALDAYRAALHSIETGAPPPEPALFVRLADNVHAFRLPLQPMHDLLDAFSQDVVKTRYENFAELLDYCRRSANPVGRLLLHLYDKTDPLALQQSDAICSSLQLINFCQDVAIDWQKDRIYLPMDELAQFDVSASDIASGLCNPQWQALMAHQLSRARRMMLDGANLATGLPGRIGLELRLIVCGGLRIIERIEYARHDVFRHRPTLSRLDWLIIIRRALCYTSYIGHSKTLEPRR